MAAHPLPVHSAPCVERTSYSCRWGTNAGFQRPSSPAPDTTLHSSALAQPSCRCNLLPNDWQELQGRCEGEQESCSNAHTKIKWYLWVSYYFIYSNWARIKRGNKDEHRQMLRQAAAQCFSVVSSLSTPGFSFKAITRPQNMLINGLSMPTDHRTDEGNIQSVEDGNTYLFSTSNNNKNNKNENCHCSVSTWVLKHSQAVPQTNFCCGSKLSAVFCKTK